jgi:transcriptional regulator
MQLKGTLSMLILKVLADGPLHGYRIAREIEARSQGSLSFGEGALYPALHAHERNGLLRSSLRTENGRRRRYYRLTEAGERALDDQRAEWRRLVTAVEVILGEA